MPSESDFRDAFTDLTGSDGPAETHYGREAGGFNDWFDIFETTGIEYTTDAFENFLIAFYPQEGMSADDWWYVREEFYEMYGIDEHDIDWQAWRETIGYD